MKTPPVTLVLLALVAACEPTPKAEPEVSAGPVGPATADVQPTTPAMMAPSATAARPALSDRPLIAPAPATTTDPLQDFAQAQGLSLPAASSQALLVIATQWTSPHGQLRRFEKVDAQWRQRGAAVDVVLGDQGLARGIGLHDAAYHAPQSKREGDHRAPAGLFDLGTAFGRAAHAPYTGDWPYRAVTDRDFWVDDPKAADYNTWQQLELGRVPPWSAEKLSMYSLGLVVEHNTHNPEPGAGSAIFIHPWRNASHPTVGCTALDAEQLMSILAWLKPSAQPVLLQTVGEFAVP